MLMGGKNTESNSERSEDPWILDPISQHQVCNLQAATPSLPAPSPTCVITAGVTQLRDFYYLFLGGVCFPGR